MKTVTLKTRSPMLRTWNLPATVWMVVVAGLPALHASPAVARELADQIAVQVLFEAQVVEFGGGEQFYEPTSILALKLLLRSPEAATLLREVHRSSAHPAGKVYALMGLDRIGDPELESLRAEFLASNPGPVTYVNGCFVHEDAAPHEYLQEWLDRARSYPELDEEKAVPAPAPPARGRR
jgi:hypothetical protein